jgi:hypothetical protein
MVRGGTFANMLERSREAALRLHAYLHDDPRFLTLFEPELDIVVWAPTAEHISQSSARSRQLFSKAAEMNLHLALFNYPARLLGKDAGQLERDEDQITFLRSCLMKPEHLDWIDEIWHILQRVVQEIG